MGVGRVPQCLLKLLAPRFVAVDDPREAALGPAEFFGDRYARLSASDPLEDAIPPALGLDAPEQFLLLRLPWHLPVLLEQLLEQIRGIALPAALLELLSGALEGRAIFRRPARWSRLTATPPPAIPQQHDRSCVRHIGDLVINRYRVFSKPVRTGGCDLAAQDTLSAATEWTTVMVHRHDSGYS